MPYVPRTQDHVKGIMCEPTEAELHARRVSKGQKASRAWHHTMVNKAQQMKRYRLAKSVGKSSIFAFERVGQNWLQIRYKKTMGISLLIEIFKGATNRGGVASRKGWTKQATRKRGTRGIGGV